MLFLRRLRASYRAFLHFFTESILIARGVWKLTRLPRPRVTIFGGSKIAEDHPYAALAMQLAQKLVDHDISVITGGGPGIMQASNCGAMGSKISIAGSRSMGVGVKGLDEELSNKCMQEFVLMNYFFSRKWLLTNYSEAFVIFPGGYGTLEELAEVSTLMQTKKLLEAPVVLINKKYWAPFVQWVEESALKGGLLKEKDKNLITVTDDIDEAFRIVQDRCRKSMEVSRI